MAARAVCAAGEMHQLMRFVILEVGQKVHSLGF